MNDEPAAPDLSGAPKQNGSKSLKTPPASDADAPGLAIPEAVKSKYLRRGDKFHRTAGDKPAFAIKGDTIQIGDQNALRDAVRIAKVNKWSSITVKGTKAFRQQAYMIAAAQGMTVKGYRPSALEKLDVERASDKAAKRKDQSQSKSAARAGVDAKGIKAQNAALADRFLAQSHDKNRSDPELRKAQSLVAAAVIVARDRYPGKPEKRQKFVEETKSQLASAISAGKKLAGLQPSATQRETIQDRIRQIVLAKDKTRLRER